MKSFQTLLSPEEVMRESPSSPQCWLSSGIMLRISTGLYWQREGVATSTLEGKGSLIPKFPGPADGWI